MVSLRWLILPVSLLSVPAQAEDEALPEGGAPLTVAPMPEAAVPGLEAPKAEEKQEAAKIEVAVGGYVRVVAEAIENDALTYIGRNDGFRLADARIEIGASYGEKTRGEISVEGAVASAEARNDPNAKLSVGLRDAWLEYDFTKKLQLRIGRFKAPYDSGELEATEERVLIDAPLESRGVRATQGLETEGLSVGRQLGMMLHKERLGYSKDGFDMGYAFALTNGRTGNLALNDNESVAGFARISAFVGPWVALSAAGYLDGRTVGELPNLYEENAMGLELSLKLTLDDLTVEGQALLQNTEFVTSEVDDIMAFGFHGQFSYRIWDLRFAYRYGWYDPNDRFDLDQVSEHTVGIAYLPKDTPLVFSLEGTLADEQRDLANNRLDALAQLKF
ncbi:MAG: hypothetical protein HYV07_18555 [Deltaproteobacteria bacterium]|nr:hypothetical protein [Deltaproteobacteria bacterium]